MSHPPVAVLTKVCYQHIAEARVLGGAVFVFAPFGFGPRHLADVFEFNSAVQISHEKHKA
jgi:hypothetical protein